MLRPVGVTIFNAAKMVILLLFENVSVQLNQQIAGKSKNNTRKNQIYGFAAGLSGALNPLLSFVIATGCAEKSAQPVGLFVIYSILTNK